jgi:glycosyltransferase involved in cell wall biosynthesis
MPPLKLLHVSPWVHTVGGMETLLAEHAANDAANGLAASQLSLFDRAAPSPEYPSTCLGFSWRSTPRGMRRAMAAACAARAGSVVVWYSGWGLPWFGDLDASSRRIVYLHDNEGSFRTWLPGLREWIDGVLCVNSAAADAATRLLPDLPAERIQNLDVPIFPPPGLQAERAGKPPWILGCAGRLTREHKRWDRLVPFVAELTALGIDFRVEVTSDGPLRPWLERQFRGDSRVRFLGWQTKADYWRRLQNWDVALYFSEREGGPLTLVEAMAAGVLPLYPGIGGSLGDEYAPRLDPRCLYPAGDLRSAARALRDLLASPPEALNALRRRAQTLVQGHHASHYPAAFAAFVQRVAALPRRSREPGAGRPSRAADMLPLGVLTRAWPGALWV